MASNHRRRRQLSWFGVSSFRLKSILYISTTIWGLTAAPPQLIAVGQIVAAGLNSAALVPQFVLNFRTKSKGDYSPLTSGLAAVGCAIRLFTTATLSGADPVLLSSFGIALVLNTALFLQIMYYGVVEEKLTIRQVFEADISPTASTEHHHRSNNEATIKRTDPNTKQEKWEGSSMAGETEEELTTAADLPSSKSTQTQKQQEKQQLQQQQRELLLELGPIKIRRR